jgi:hypothetical protein
MKIRQKTVRSPGKRAISAIADGLEEIGAHFQFVGFGNGADKPAEDLASEASSEEDQPEEDSSEEDDFDADDDDDGYSGFSTYDREEIEVAIDEFISTLIANGILRKSKSGKLPSFSGVFERVFGKDHEISKMARQFEEYIEGYFGAIDYDDMRAAYSEFQEIRDFLNKEAEKTSDVAKS